MKIRICTPFYSEFEAVKSGAKECLSYSDIKFVFEPRHSGPLMFNNRNSLINDQKSQMKKQFPLEEYDAFLFVDSDISFSLNNVLKLIESKKEIIGSPYLKHDDRGLYSTGNFHKEIFGSTKFNYSIIEKGLKQVDFTGTGFLLIQRNVFEILEYPWFEPIKVEYGNQAEVVGEDIAFCMKAKQNGFQIYCDFDNPVIHKLRRKKNINWDINSIIKENFENEN